VRPVGPERGPVLVLVGPMGSGKTAVGASLARRWGVTMRDTDHDIEQSTGLRVAEIFETQGEDGFRDLEHRVVVQALATHDGVLALGGGAVVRADTRAALAEYAARGGRVVLLEVDADVALGRVGHDANRPLLAGDARGRWEALLEQRRAWYEEVATLRVRSGGRSAAHVAQQVERLLTAH
jgi:shikimate kinase/3-dehydroquinate synthase